MGSLSSGCSDKPLAQKLGVKAGCNLLVVDAPANYLQLLNPLPSDVQFQPGLTKAVDIVHVFRTKREELRKALQDFRHKLRPNGVVWVSWPKKAAKVSTDITEDVIREVALPIGFVDIKVCAVSEVWSGLKLVIRKEYRPSGRVAS